MSERVRTLERAYRESGETGALLAWLRARHRAGEVGAEITPWLGALTEGTLEQSQVELAAYLGDPLARCLDEERVISLATYLSEEFELVPVVLGDSGLEDEAVRRWISGLARWSPSWVTHAQLAVAEGYYAQGPESAPADADYWELEEWTSSHAADRRLLDAGWRCFNSPTPETFGELQARGSRERTEAGRAASAAEDLIEQATLGWEVGPWLIYVGDEVDQVPTWVREALLPEVLRTQ
ncbi:MAG: hypothetical protein JKY65_07560 [Planctomycetes bacterium]|nr:hypothetical protein [Planctomycetota bacterium]